MSGGHALGDPPSPVKRSTKRPERANTRADAGPGANQQRLLLRSKELDSSPKLRYFVFMNKRDAGANAFGALGAGLS